VVDELCISCRALGRRLEDLLIGEALRRVVHELGCARVAFEYAEGPRNHPARHWLEAFAGQPLPAPAGRLELAKVPPTPDVPIALAWTD
jgi:predicted enzyme involved in methoxymalonyl-ACP biosynthesis